MDLDKAREDKKSYTIEFLMGSPDDNAALFLCNGIQEGLQEYLDAGGVDGTLSYRMRGGKAFRNVHAKTGTVTGVSSLAGYVHASNGHLLAFVIINQNVLKSREARTFQDRFCEILAR